jgi:DNA-binding response OmpR family regulator
MLTHSFDILILDLGFNDGDGLEWLTNNPNLAGKGLIIVTARDSIKDKIMGIQAGADVYLTKPVPLEIVSATAHNLYKRISKKSIAQWQINATNWKLKAPDNQEIKLTHSEMLLMVCFSQNLGQVVTKDALITSLGHSPEYYDSRRLEIMIRRLRSKVLGQFGFDLPFETVHGKGFAFSAPISRVG